MSSDDMGNPRYSLRILVFLAIVLTAIMFVFPLAVSFPLLDPDEGLHASIAQEMAERGEWTTPTLLGRPFLDKPILYFWFQTASLRLFGPSEMAVRLPGLLFGLLGAITTGLLGWRLFDRRIGLMAYILYATTILPTALAQAASHDVALIPWINLTLLMFWEAEHTDSRRATIFCSLGAGLFLGLSILTKGLSGVAVVGLAYGSYLLITRRLRPIILLRGVLVLLIAGLVASPWYVLVEHNNPGYLRYFFIDRHLLGFATDMQPHGDQPWWYYLPFLLGGGLPWIGYLPIVAQDNREHRHKSEATPLLWSWLIGWTLLMTLAGSKLATYLWPVFPPMAILAATAWASLIDGSLGAAARRSFVRTFVLSSWTGPLVLPIVVFTVQMMYGVQFSWPVWAVVGVMAILTLTPLFFWRAGRCQTSLAAAVLSLAGQFVILMALVLPPVAETCSAHLLAEHFNRLGHMPTRLLIVEGRIGSLVYYLDPKIRNRLTPDRIQQTLAKELPVFQPGDVLAVQEWKVPKLQKYFDAEHHPFESIGSYRLYGPPLAE
jgi:4-amino-4-deoxy-L-arabinose transferase-like glycosyltransferase